MPTYTIVEEEPGIAGYTIFTIDKPNDRRSTLNLMMNRPEKGLPELGIPFRHGDKVIAPASPKLGTDITVVGPGRRAGTVSIRIGDIGPYDFPEGALAPRPSRRRRKQYLSPRKVFDYSAIQRRGW